MTRTSGSPLPVGSSARKSASACAAAVRVPSQLPEPSAGESSGAPPQPEPLLLKWFTATVTRSPVPTSSKVWMRAGRLR